MPAVYTRFYVLCFCAAVFTGALPAVLHAQDSAPPGVDILPAKSLSTDELSAVDENAATHPLLRLTPDKSEIVKLDRDTTTVIVGNPNHISVMADTARTLIVVPKAPGATYFAALDEKGEVIMQRHVIVGSPKEKYVRIRRSCATAEGDCQATQVYYCPDMCHEIIMNTKEEKSSDSAGKDALAEAVQGKENNDSGSAGTETGSDAVTTP